MLLGINLRFKPTNMAILGIGVDVVHLPRFLALLKRRHPDRFASRILSATEYNQWQTLQISDAQDHVQFLAVRYIDRIVGRIVS